MPLKSGTRKKKIKGLPTTSKKASMMALGYKLALLSYRSNISVIMGI